MRGAPDDSEVLLSVPTEMEAAIIVNVLAEHGVRAVAVGGYTSGFQAEAPGVVKVIVTRADLAEARRVLSEFDGGDSANRSAPEEDAESSSHEDDATDDHRPQPPACPCCGSLDTDEQWSLAALLAFVTIWPLLPFRRRYRCTMCGHTWKQFPTRSEF